MRHRALCVTLICTRCGDWLDGPDPANDVWDYGTEDAALVAACAADWRITKADAICFACRVGTDDCPITAQASQRRAEHEHPSEGLSSRLVGGETAA